MGNDLREENSPLQIVINELDELAEQWTHLHQAQGGWVCQRGRHRRKFRAPCDIWFFEHGESAVRQSKAQTRNLSERGIGLITRSPVFQGVPIEICIQVADRPPTHLGGVVVFCRYTQLGVHELGVALKTHQNTPIFAVNPQRATLQYPWLQQALRDVKLAAQLGKALPTTR